MARSTRSRKTSALLNEKTEEKMKNDKQNTEEKLNQKRTIRTRATVVKESPQNQTKLAETSTATIKNTRSKAVSKTKPDLSSKENDSDKNLARTIKSPVFRDRTNVNNKRNEENLISSKDDGKSSQNKQITKNVTKNKKDKELATKLKVSTTKSSVKKPIVQSDSYEENLNLKKDSKKLTKKTVKLEPANPKTSSCVPKLKEVPTDLSVSSSNDEETKKISQQISDESQSSSSIKKRVSRRKNITVETVEQLLNNDDDDNDNDDNGDKSSDMVENENVLHGKDDITELSDNENVGEDKKPTKKFFKTKNGKESNKPIIKLKTNSCINKQKKTKSSKKTKKNESTLGLEIDEVRDSAPEKNLRSKAPINYCELSKLSQSSNSAQEKSEKDKYLLSNIGSHQKGVPIYKTISLSQDKTDGNVYEFFYDSPESNKKSKKKKITRKPAVKRIKKTTNSGMKKSLKIQKKSDERVKKCNEKKLVLPNSPTRIPENIVNVGESTLEEASTLKIISIENLENSKKINLMRTPSKTKKTDSNTSQPTALYSNMVNHSLIRKSLSPIKKVSENFDASSPWRPLETFSRVQKMVQSTPQVNKQFLKSKVGPVQLNLNEKSIHSQSTIHLSCNDHDRFDAGEISDFVCSKNPPVPDTKSESLSPKKIASSPRKFGTEISNVSSGKSGSSSSVNSRSSLQSLQSKASFEELKDQEDIPMIAAFANKENISPRATRSPRKKCTTPCPFRFEKIRSPKKLACQELRSVDTITLQEEKTGSRVILPEVKKQNTPFLKQTNLNAFLNLDEIPEKTSITTSCGFFDDVCPTQVNGKKTKKPVEELNVDNAFGFDDDDNDDDNDIDEELLTIRTEPAPTIATKKDVEKSIKGKIFPKVRVKSALPSRISQNAVKQTLLEDDIKKKTSKDLKIVEPTNESDSEDKDEDNNNDIFDDTETKKKDVLHSISFSDTFDLLSKDEELESKVPDEVPLFVDLEPAHFTEPPRRSYVKRKRAVCFDKSMKDSSEDDGSDDDTDDDGKKKKSKKRQKIKKKKESKLSKEQEKRMNDWVKNINNTFEEIDEFDLVVE